MTPTVLAERTAFASQGAVESDRTLGAHVAALQQHIVGVLAREGCALDTATLDDLSESILAEAVRLVVRWVEEER